MCFGVRIFGLNQVHTHVFFSSFFSLHSLLLWESEAAPCNLIDVFQKCMVVQSNWDNEAIE